MHAQAPAGAQGQGRGGGQGGGRRGAAAVPAPNGQNENIHVDGWNRKQQSLESSGKKPGLLRFMTCPGFGNPCRGIAMECLRAAPGTCLRTKPTRLRCRTRLREKRQWRPIKRDSASTSLRFAEINDPFDTCDPIGFPRIILFNLRAVQIVQTPKQVLMLYQNTRTFRTIWTDRELPKAAEITEPRWFGYSVGKWTDPTTLVVTTTGLDESTWIDNTGRPHSDQLVVEETYHRVDELNIDLTVKITDPVMYTQPWYPLKNFRLGMNSPDFDIREMICSVSQQALFNQLLKSTTDPATEQK
jgi:hypothetical protein